MTGPPSQGRANEAILDVFAKYLTVRRHAIHITLGHRSRAKVADLKHKLEIAVLADGENVS